MKNPFGKPIYLDHFGLREAPYTTNPDERFFYPARQHKAAMDMCGSVIEKKEGAALIIGGTGTGKTTLLNRMRTMLKMEPAFTTAFINNAGDFTSKFQLIKAILESFSQECVGRDYLSRSSQLKEFLVKEFQEGKIPVLFIDELQHMPPALLEGLREVLNFETGQSGKLIQLILGAMPKINQRLRRAESFANRLTIEWLRAMDRIEAEEMLFWRYKQAGGVNFPFDRRTLDALHRVSKGVPRIMCSLAQLSLEASARGNIPITSELILSAKENKFLPN